MAEITAQMVKDLRDKTGAGMMDCKKALNESGGDMEAAIDWLRKHGYAKAAKKAGRVAAEGLIGVAVGEHSGALVEVNSETDFVARNDQFKEFVKNAAAIALKEGCDLEALMQKSIGGTSVQQALTDLIAKIGVLVALKSTADRGKLLALGKQLAMHVAAANPLALTPAHLPKEVVDRERAVQADLARQSGKPENVIEKMLEGRMRKFYEESVLLHQTFVIDQETQISKVLEKASKDLGAPVEIEGFVRYQVGEGIDKVTDDFADEVSKLAGH